MLRTNDDTYLSKYCHISLFIVGIITPPQYSYTVRNITNVMLNKVVSIVTSALQTFEP
jgi:hypothetical protein